MVSRKQAPRREVLEIKKIGDWGDVTYSHILGCGHIEVRKRASTASHISCMFCLHERERPAPKANTASPDFDFDVTDTLSSTEADIVSLKAKLAARLQLPNDAINVQVNAFGKVQYVAILMTAEEAARL